MSLGRLPVSSAAQEMTRSPEPLPPPPHPAAPSKAAPASPAPPSLRNSLRLRPVPVVFVSMLRPLTCLPFPTGSAGLLIMPEERGQAHKTFFEQRKLRVLGLLVSLRRQPRPEVRRGNPALRETGDVGPGLLRPYLEACV